MHETCNPERAIAELRRCQEVLLASLEQTKQDLEALERSMRILQGIGPDSHRQDARARPEDTAASIVDLPPQKAVLAFFQEHAGRSFKPSALAKKLRALGYEPTTSNPNVFVTQIRTACLRLSAKGILRLTDVNGKVAFQHPEMS